MRSFLTGTGLTLFIIIGIFLSAYTIREVRNYRFAQQLQFSIKEAMSEGMTRKQQTKLLQGNQILYTDSQGLAEIHLEPIALANAVDRETDIKGLVGIVLTGHIHTYTFTHIIPFSRPGGLPLLYRDTWHTPKGPVQLKQGHAPHIQAHWNALMTFQAEALDFVRWKHALSQRSKARAREYRQIIDQVEDAFTQNPNTTGETLLPAPKQRGSSVPSDHKAPSGLRLPRLFSP